MTTATARPTKPATIPPHCIFCKTKDKGTTDTVLNEVYLDRGIGHVCNDKKACLHRCASGYRSRVGK